MYVDVLILQGVGFVKGGEGAKSTNQEMRGATVNSG